MPTITRADKCMDNLVDATTSVTPMNSIIEDAVLQLMVIYRKQPLDASDAESAQRVLRCLAKTQRVQIEQGSMPTLKEIAINAQKSNKQSVPTAQVDMSPDLGIFEF
jgi:hypothetical protein